MRRLFGKQLREVFVGFGKPGGKKEKGAKSYYFFSCLQRWFTAALLLRCVHIK